MTSDVTFQRLSSGTPTGTIITLFTTKVDENYEKGVIVFDVPVPKSKWGSTSPTKYAIDLLQLNHVFTITGHIHASSSNATNSDTSEEAKADLITMFKYGGGQRLVYAGNNYSVHIRKMQITESQHDSASPSEYTVTMEVVEATDK